MNQTIDELSDSLPFCSNPDCLLHVRSGERGVIGTGNWAELPDGILIGRSIYHGLYLCDPCGKTWRPVAALLVLI